LARSPVLIIAEKELSDAVRSKRLWALMAVLLMLYGMMVFVLGFGRVQVTVGEKGEVRQAMTIDPLTQILLGLSASIGFVAPLVGLALGYDAISGEREKGTIRLLLARPIFRDQVINGKALGALATIALALGLSTLILVGLSSALLGATLDLDLVCRVTLYVLLAILLSFVYYSLSLLVSALTRRASRSLMISLLLWMVFTFVIPLVGFLVATAVVGPMPPPENEEAYMEWVKKVADISSTINAVTPNTHFSEVADKLLTARTTVKEFAERIEAIPETVADVLFHGWVNIAALVLYTAIPYAISYAVFTASERE